MASPYEHSRSTNQYTLSHKFFGASVCYSAPFFQAASRGLARKSRKDYALLEVTEAKP